MAAGLPRPANTDQPPDQTLRPKRKIRIICISDTHNHGPGEGWPLLPRGDILVHAGDLTNQGSLAELSKAADWLTKADFAVKIVVAGNHDLSLDPDYAHKHPEERKGSPAEDEAEQCRRLIRGIPNTYYLQHEAIRIRIGSDPRDKPVVGVVAVADNNENDNENNIDNNNGDDDDSVYLRVFGSPFSPDRGAHNWAFQYRDDDAEALWSQIPPDTDLLITHTPPAGICDTSNHWTTGGCASLKAALARLRPSLHICGHCHEGRGAEVIRWLEESEHDDNDEQRHQTREWRDPGAGNKKQSLLDLTRAIAGGGPLQRGSESAVVNASIMSRSRVAPDQSRGPDGSVKVFNKPIVVDLCLSGIVEQREFPG